MRVEATISCTRAQKSTGSQYIRGQLPTMHLMPRALHS